MVKKSSIAYVLIFALILFRASPLLAQMSYPSFADLAEKSLPSVVNISIKSDNNVENYYNQSLNKHEALGSGFIIDEQGYIVTNFHVVDKAASINVVLSDNSILEASLVGVDKKLDLALIKVNTNKKLSAIKFGDSDKIRVGEWILAIGNPFGLGGSVTAGIVSAKSRDIESGSYDNFIQTDASINQGSSGGPMFNMAGEVIGINSAIFSTTGNSMGVGFAIPSNLAQWAINQIKANGEVKRGWVGIKIQPSSTEISVSLGLKENQGVVVSGVAENSPSQKAGIEAGDVILSFNNQIIDNTKNLSRLVAETQIGKTIPIEIWRNKQNLKKEIFIEEMPLEPEVQQTKPKMEEEPIVENNYNFEIKDLGISIASINPETLDKFNLKSEAKGVIVTEIMANSDAEIKGLKKGDIIEKIDKNIVLDKNDIMTYVNEAKMDNKRPVLLQIHNNGTPHFVAVKLVEHE